MFRKNFRFERKIPQHFRYVPERSKQILNARLFITNLEKAIPQKVDAFLFVFNRNIEWYYVRIKREHMLVWWYNIVSLFLIAAIPLLILQFTHSYQPEFQIVDIQDESQTEFFTAAIVTLLSCILGLHKAATLWVGKRKLLGVYYAALTQLKSKFYAFEFAWNDGSILKSGTDGSKSGTNTEFDQAIEQAIMEGRAIADAERQKYYEAIQNPQIDVGNILTGAFTQATSLIKNFQSKSFVHELDKIEIEMRAEESQRQIISEVKQIESATRAYEVLLLKTELDLKQNSKNKALTKLETELISKINSSKISLITKRSQLR